MCKRQSTSVSASSRIHRHSVSETRALCTIPKRQYSIHNWSSYTTTLMQNINIPPLRKGPPPILPIIVLPSPIPIHRIRIRILQHRNSMLLQVNVPVFNPSLNTYSIYPRYSTREEVQQRAGVSVRTAHVVHEIFACRNLTTRYCDEIVVKDENVSISKE